MAALVEVNGSQIEESYLKECVDEARSYKWIHQPWQEEGRHTHCMICQVAIAAAENSDAYKSRGGWLCSHCYCHFISGRNAMPAIKIANNE